MPKYIIEQKVYYFSTFNWEDINAWSIGKIEGNCYTAGINTYYWAEKKKCPADRNKRTVIYISDIVSPPPPIPPYPQNSYYSYEARIGYNYSYTSFTSRYNEYSKFELYIDEIYKDYEILNEQVWSLYIPFIYNTYYPAKSFNGENRIPVTLTDDKIGIRIFLYCDTEISQSESAFIANICYLKFIKYLNTPEPISFNFGFFIPQKRNL